jgi:hypothetical protein
VKRDLQTWTSIILAAGFLLVLAGLGMQRAWRAVGPAARVVDPIRQVPPLERLRQKQGRVGPVELATGFEASAPMQVRRISDTHFEVDVGPRHRHWFLFRLDGVAGKIVRIDLTEVNLTRWKTLNPVYSYTADLSDPAAFTTVATRSPGRLTEAWNGPPLPQTAGVLLGAISYGRLSTGFRWAVSTPSVFSMNDGIVVAVPATIGAHR